MAILNQHDGAWWEYAVQFARRGLWPTGEIETHGPHDYPGDRKWGEAECVDLDRHSVEIVFAGPHGCTHYSDIRGLQMQYKEDATCRFPILSTAELGRAKRWLVYATKRSRQESQDEGGQGIPR